MRKLLCLCVLCLTLSACASVQLPGSCLQYNLPVTAFAGGYIYSPLFLCSEELDPGEIPSQPEQKF